MFDTIMEILDKMGALLYVIVPALFSIYFNLRDKVINKKKEIQKENTAKNKEIYKVWEHEESKKVISKIKELCNLYKDKGSMGLVQYLQLENGTMATSKLCNMFVSCLAEDDRYGRVHKLISKLQRVPYSKMTGWLNKIVDIQDTDNMYVITEDISKADYSFSDIVDAPEVKSCIIAPVYDPNEILLGVCVFYYSSVKLNNNKETEVQLMNRFKTSVESVLLEYHMNRKEKQSSLRLAESDL